MTFKVIRKEYFKFVPQLLECHVTRFRGNQSFEGQHINSNISANN